MAVRSHMESRLTNLAMLIIILVKPEPRYYRATTAFSGHQDELIVREIG